VPQRRLRILAQLASDGSAALTTRRLCEVCVDVTQLSGAGIMLMSGATPRGSMCASDSVSALVEQLQYELGEGPCIDAYRLNEPVAEPDLAHPDVVRWMAFTLPAVAAGVRAVFGFPLQVGVVKIGALNLYRDQPGPLDAEQHADALAMADVVAESILAMQAEAPRGSVSVQIEANAQFQWVVHQAAGMVAAQLDVPAAEAMARMRAYAFANDTTLTALARDVVARSVRFEPEATP
jgi:GAF domain-containing protein